MLLVILMLELKPLFHAEFCGSTLTRSQSRFYRDAKMWSKMKYESTESLARFFSE
jgi:hypothetical protein